MPSGHAFQAYYLSHILSRQYPDKKQLFDKLAEKVANIMPIIQYSELYEDTVGISLTIEKTKVKLILDYYFNLLDKNQKKALSENVRLALLYL